MSTSALTTAGLSISVLSSLDWAIIAAFFIISLIIGLVVMKRAGKNSEEFFLSGRNMPWWLLGISMVATTFSTDTPNLVTDLVRTNGVAGNWAWWAFLLTGMLTVFIYAKLWRRSAVTTDVEFYEIRYSGKPAAFLRGFRAIYLGVFFNIMIMASVTLAAIKIGGVMLGLTPMQTVSIAAVITVIYSMMGGLSGVLITDFFQFGVAMFGSVMAAIIALRQPEVGGLANLLAHPNVSAHLSILPDFNNMEVLIPVLLIPLAVQWWSVWYPGAEPGGGGYIAQRMLAAKNERHAVGATLLFNACHYALRPWPWIIVALASMIVYPDIASLKSAFPNVEESVVKNDLAYSAMLTFLPSGLLGLVIASLIAAYMSTIATHLNWGSSYVVNDFWKRFANPKASERELVTIGRISTVGLMFFAAVLALFLSNAVQAFQIMLQIGAGTGLLFILRWFWWRINAFSELAAMVVSFILALYFQLIHDKVFVNLPLKDWEKLCIGVGLTTVAWILVTLLTPPADEKTLRSFYRLVKPGGPGWAYVVDRAKASGDPIDEGEGQWAVPAGILCMVFGCFAVYGALFATGYAIYGNLPLAGVMTLVAAASTIILTRLWGKLGIR